MNKLKTYAVGLAGHLKVTAHVVAESPERAAEIAWINSDPRPGESVTYSDGMESLDGEVEVVGVTEMKPVTV